MWKLLSALAAVCVLIGGVAIALIASYDGEQWEGGFLGYYAIAGGAALLIGVIVLSVAVVAAIRAQRATRRDPRRL